MSELAPSRWLAVITYRKDNGMLPVPYDIEELEELQEIVERGPDWRTIDNINIVLQRRSGNDDNTSLTLEQAEAR